jgi:hypothetical protein
MTSARQSDNRVRGSFSPRYFFDSWMQHADRTIAD